MIVVLLVFLAALVCWPWIFARYWANRICTSPDCWLLDQFLTTSRVASVVGKFMSGLVALLGAIALLVGWGAHERSLSFLVMGALITTLIVVGYYLLATKFVSSCSDLGINLILLKLYRNPHKPLESGTAAKLREKALSAEAFHRFLFRFRGLGLEKVLDKVC